MCLAKINLIGEDPEKQKTNLADIARIELTDEGLTIVGFLGEVTRLKAKIKSIDFVDSVVHLEKF